MGNLITLYHNTSNTNAISISKEGIKGGMRLSAYGKGSEAEGAGVWCSTIRGYGYGGATITFQIDEDERELRQQNDTEYIVYRDIKPEEIIDIDLMVSDIPCNPKRKDSINSTVESDIPEGIDYWGKDDLLKVFSKNQNHLAQPYNIEQLKHLIETGEKYCKGTIKITESKHKLEEVSRNELLAKAKAETITRYNKSAGYKGFSLVDIDTTAIKTRDCLIITNRVGDYFDTIELEDILYWVGLEVDEDKDKKMWLEPVRRALLGAMDGMDIKVDCECGDFVYRFAYMSTVLGYKYGRPENRPSNITNPNGYGAMCKHLIALLSNKSWVKQVASTLQQWIIENIDWVRSFLKVKEEDFKLPDEYARYLGRHGAMKKAWDKMPDTETEEEPQEDTEDSNEVGGSGEENNEETNDTPEEKPTLNNQTNMPKNMRNSQDEEDLEEK